MYHILQQYITNRQWFRFKIEASERWGRESKSLRDLPAARRRSPCHGFVMARSEQRLQEWARWVCGVGQRLGSTEWVKGVGRWRWALGGSRAWVCDGEWRNWSSQREEMKSVRTNWGEKGATGRNGERGERKNKIKYSNLVWTKNKIIYIFLPLSYSAHLSLDVHCNWEAKFFCYSSTAVALLLWLVVLFF